MIETVIQFLDTVEDAIIATANRMRRKLSRRPKERRQVARTRSAGPQRRQAERDDPPHSHPDTAAH